jgi:ABC-type sugar transport system substrate-binding protein
MSRSTKAAGTAFAALLVAATAACATEGTPASAGGTPAAGKGDALAIQFVNPLPNYPSWRTIGDCMADAAEARGADLTESGPSGQALDPTVMIQQIQQAIANKVDAILTLPASDGFAPVLEQAQDADIITATIYGPDGLADINVGVDWTAIGEQMVGAVAELPGDHKVGLVAAADTGLGKSWLDGMKAAAEKTDNVEIVGEVYTGDDAAKALPQVNALLTAHPEVTEVMTHMGTTTPGAVAAIKQQNRVGKTFLVANGTDNGGVEALEEGTANLMMMQDFCTLGENAINAIVDKAEGTEPEPILATIELVAVDEYESYVDKGWG